MILEVGNPVMVLMSSGGGIGPGAHSRHGSLQASWSVGEIADTLVRGRVCPPLSVALVVLQSEGRGWPHCHGHPSSCFDRWLHFFQAAWLPRGLN